jgi:hypothetical protein
MRRNFFNNSNNNFSLLTNTSTKIFNSKRFFQAQYGLTLRSHSEMYEKYVSAKPTTATTKRFDDGEQFAKAALPLLESIEDRLALWKRHKWEFRVPALLSPEEKAAITALLRRLQTTTETYTAKRRQMLADTQLVHQLTGGSTPLGELALKPRSWLQKHVSNLRTQGRAEEAKALREAWIRMELLGGPDYDLLERLVLVYGLGKMGTFDRTFTNTIRLKNQQQQQQQDSSSVDVHAQSGLITLDQSDPLAELIALTLTNVPDIHILYDFLGWNEGLPYTRQNDVVNSFNSSYTTSLGEYMSRCLKHKFPEGAVLNQRKNNNFISNNNNNNNSSSSSSSSSQLLFSDNKNKIYLMRTDENIAASQAQTGVNISPTFSLWQGPNLTIITKAAHNKYLRQYQLPNRRQLEGMCRRSAFVFGHKMDDVRARTLLLPPNQIDRRSLLRIHAALDPSMSIATPKNEFKNSASASAVERAAQSEEIVLDSATLSSQQHIPPEFRSWVSLYQNITVPIEDEDFNVVSSMKPEEEWYKL